MHDSRQYIDHIIADLPQKNKCPLVTEYVRMLRPLLADLHQRNLTRDELLLKRQQLNQLRHRLVERVGTSGRIKPGKRKHETAIRLLSAVIWILKRLGAESTNDGQPDDHEMSDHAFCAGLRRLGHDVGAWKDRLKDEAAQAGLIAVGDNGRIVTFLPAREAN